MLIFSIILLSVVICCFLVSFISWCIPNVRCYIYSTKFSVNYLTKKELKCQYYVAAELFKFTKISLYAHLSAMILSLIGLAISIVNIIIYSNFENSDGATIAFSFPIFVFLVVISVYFIICLIVGIKRYIRMKKWLIFNYKLPGESLIERKINVNTKERQIYPTSHRYPYFTLPSRERFWTFYKNDFENLYSSKQKLLVYLSLIIDFDNVVVGIASEKLNIDMLRDEAKKVNII
ncbi:Hypothetical protein, predicted transmembrane protein [Mycoplasmopsis bovigenitalium 51080]|uniref:Uncharacterized protein n=1 Tax=Mycoplasmopsis bovigenitalium 51080 TaxID=1188235 RepID=N9TVG3_9BACT|nr:Hypothetical protein, predicted transmembrane protein [Mycoplasmopsis bovigenitalium 51080]